VLSGAPFGYRYVRKNDHAEACYEIVPHEAAIVAELFARYADGGVAIGALARWLSRLGVPSRTGKICWGRSVTWAMRRCHVVCVNTSMEVSTDDGCRGIRTWCAGGVRAGV
jgi:site-specific DNA recombinase